MATPTITVRLADDLIAALDARSDSRTEALRRILGRYLDVCKTDLPALSGPEWRMCAEALNGWFMVEHPAHFMWAEIADAIKLNNLDEKWGVADGPGLVERLRDMPKGQLVAMLDTLERFWRRDPDAEAVVNAD